MYVKLKQFLRETSKKTHQENSVNSEAMHILLVDLSRVPLTIASKNMYM